MHNARLGPKYWEWMQPQKEVLHTNCDLQILKLAAVTVYILALLLFFFLLLDAFLPCYVPFLHPAAASLWTRLAHRSSSVHCPPPAQKAAWLGAQLAVEAL